MDYSEKWGRDVDEAVKLALEDLKVSIDEVDVTVLEEPSRGFFGIGSKLALVRVEKKKTEEPEPEPPAPAPVVRTEAPKKQKKEKKNRQEKSTKSRHRNRCRKFSEKMMKKNFRCWKTIRQLLS